MLSIVKKSKKKFLLFISCLLIFSNISNISYSLESSDCKFELNNFQKYKVNLLDCIKENGETPPKDLLVNLSEKTTSFLSNDILKKKKILKEKYINC